MNMEEGCYTPVKSTYLDSYTRRKERLGDSVEEQMLDVLIIVMAPSLSLSHAHTYTVRRYKDALYMNVWEHLTQSAHTQYILY